MEKPSPYFPNCQTYYTPEYYPLPTWYLGLLYSYSDDREGGENCGHGDGYGYTDSCGNGRGVGWTRPFAWVQEPRSNEINFGDGRAYGYSTNDDIGCGEGLGLPDTRLW